MTSKTYSELLGISASALEECSRGFPCVRHQVRWCGACARAMPQTPCYEERPLPLPRARTLSCSLSLTHTHFSLSLSLFLSLALCPVSVHGWRNRSLGHERHVPPGQVGCRQNAVTGGCLRYRKGGADSAYGSAVCEKYFVDFFPIMYNNVTPQFLCSRLNGDVWEKFCSLMLYVWKRRSGYS